MTASILVIAVLSAVAHSATIRVITVSSAGVPSAGSWSAAAPISEARQEVGVGVLGGEIYVIGGLRGDLSTADTVEVYDPQTDTWRFAAAPPVPVHHTAVATVGDRLYVIGGWSNFFGTPLNTLFAYDPALNSWETKAPMPTRRAALAAASLDGKIYAAGGSGGENDFAVYDPVLDEWTVLPDLPTPRNHHAAGALGGRIYVAGGRSGPNTAALEAFDPATGVWDLLTPMPTARSGIAAAVVADRFFVFGGEGNDADPDGVFDEVEAYSRVSDTWTTFAPMPTPRHGIGAAVIGGRIHIPGGGPVEGFGVTAVHEVFVPEPSTALLCMPMLVAAAVRRRNGRPRVALSSADSPAPSHEARTR